MRLVKVKSFLIRFLVCALAACTIHGCEQGGGRNGISQPTGACCLPNDSCGELTQAACLQQNGIYQGHDTSCTPDACAQPSGACCLPNGSCQDSTRSACTADGGTYRGDDAACAPNPCTAPSGGGSITFVRPDGHVYRLEAREDAFPVDITEALDVLSPRAPDDWLNISPDGDWLLLSTERFDSECAGYACLALLPADLSSFEVVRADGQVFHGGGGATNGFCAVSNDGDLIVCAGVEGPNATDLFAISREGDAWSSLRVLTGDSPFAFNDLPAIAGDGRNVVFDCGPTAYGQVGTNICEVGTDGTGFRLVRAVGDAPAGATMEGDDALHSPDYLPDSSIVFEGDWGGERIWRVDNGGLNAARLVVEPGSFTDNSPCVLPDGRVVALRYGGPAGNRHVIHIIDPDSGEEFTLYDPGDGQDVADIGIGCGGSAGADGNGGGSGTFTGRYFPADSVWYEDISSARRDAESDEVIGFLASVGGFGLGRMQIDFSIEVLQADADTPLRPFQQTEDWYDPDCDLDDAPVPAGGALEGESGYECESDGDCHLIVVDAANGRLYEMWRANLVDGEFFGGCLAVWDMTRVYGPSGRGENCTSADAAGFPIAPLLFSADEVAAGEINHAIRFILPGDRIRGRVYVHPATHSVPEGNATGPESAPVLGARLRLRADYPLDTLPNNAARVVARAMQRYGILLSDLGQVALTAQSDRFTTAKWAGLLESHDLELIQVTDFEMVEAGARIPWTGDCVR